MRSSLLSLLSLTGLLVSGCGGKNDDSNGPGDSVDTQPVYDEGCITVDGEGGYAHLVDAITVADEGGTIALCEGTFAEPTEVTKGVILTGAGPGTILVGDGTNPALNVTASNVTVSDMTIQGSYTGLGISGADVTVSNVTFEATGGWGIAANAATGLTVSGCTFDQNVGGGIDVEGGDALITGNTFTLPTGFAIQLGAAAVGTVSSNEIDGVIAEKNNYKDGYGVYVLGGAFATLDGNTIAGATSISVKVKDGSVDASNEVWSESAYGLFVDGGSATVATSTLTDQSVGGVVGQGDSFSLSNTSITTTSAASCDVGYEDWAGECSGAFFAADVAVELADVAISGFNDVGVYVQAYTSGYPTTTLTNVSIDDVGRMGIYLYGVTGTATGVSVTNLREPELAAPCTDGVYNYVNYTAAMILAGTELDIADSTFTDNAGWGVSAFAGDSGSRVTITGSTFANLGCTGVVNLNSAVEVDDSSFTGPNAMGWVQDNVGSTSVTNSAFTGNHALSSYSYDGGDGHIYGYEYGPSGMDVIGYQSLALIVSGNTFTDGDQAVYAYLSDAEITGNTFTGYEDGVLFAYQNTNTLYSDNVADDFGGALVTDYYSRVEMVSNTVGTTRASTGYSANYTDGVLTSEYTYTSYAQVVYAYGSTDLPCELLVDGLDVEDSYYNVIEASDCSLEVSDVNVGTSGSGASGQAISASWHLMDPLVVIDGLSVESVLGNGLYLSSSTAGTSYVDISGLDFGTVSGTGFYASGFQDVNLADSNLGEDASYGVQISGRSTGDSTASIDGVSVGTGAADGFYASRLAALTVVNSYATGRDVGLVIEGSTADVQNNFFTANTEYGMVCAPTTTLAACAANDLSGNTLGEHFGCSDDCGI